MIDSWFMIHDIHDSIHDSWFMIDSWLIKFRIQYKPAQTAQTPLTRPNCLRLRLRFNANANAIANWIRRAASKSRLTRHSFPFPLQARNTAFCMKCSAFTPASSKYLTTTRTIDNTTSPSTRSKGVRGTRKAQSAEMTEAETPSYQLSTCQVCSGKSGAKGASTLGQPRHTKAPRKPAPRKQSERRARRRRCFLQCARWACVPINSWLMTHMIIFIWLI